MPHVHVRRNFDPYVYLIHDARGSRYKVGLTGKLRKRLKTLATAVGGELRLVWVIASNDGRLVEDAWKRKWADRCLGGEWYDLTPEDVAEFCSVRTVNWRDREPIEFGDPLAAPKMAKYGPRVRYVMAIGEVVRRVDAQPA
jgi:hypothetical protein